MFWLEIFLVIVLMMVLVFAISLLEGAWWRIKMEQVVKHEMEKGACQRTRIAKQLLKEQPVIIGLIMFWLNAVLYLGPLILGWLTAKRISEEAVVAVLIAYPIVQFYVGEVMSKNLGYVNAAPIALRTSPVIWVGSRFCFPITWLLRLTNRWVIRLSKGARQMIIQEEDVKAVAETAKQNGALHEAEAKHICRLIEIGNQEIRSLVSPLERCCQIQVKAPLADLRSAVQKKCPILITDAKGELVIGLLSAEDIVELLLIKPPKGETIDLSAAVGSCVTLPANASITEGYHLMKKNPVGVVRETSSGKEKGKLLGVVTLRDILEKIAEVEYLE